MIDSLVGVFVMVGVTSFMAALVELGNFVLSPPSSPQDAMDLIRSSPELSATVTRFSSATSIPRSAVETELAARLCELPRDTSGVPTPGCR